jgi:hypothetical protein
LLLQLFHRFLDFLFYTLFYFQFCNQDARKFAQRFHGFKNGYSIDITPGGSGAKSIVEIRKTTKIYEKQMEEFNLVENNIRKIDELLKQIQV